MSATGNHCLINQPDCGRVAGNPVCPKCDMDERVVYPGQADLEAALEAAQARYLAAQEAAEPPPPPPELPKPPPPSEPPLQLPRQPDPEPPVNPDVKKNGTTRLGLGVVVVALLGGGWWWKDQQDQRLQLAQEQAASQALAAEQARSEQEAEKQRADEAEAQRAAAEKAKAQIANQARRERDLEKKRADEAEAQRVAAERAQAQVAEQARREHEAEKLRADKAERSALLHGRYQILAGGSEVKDVQTGLVWARCSVGQTWDGVTCTGRPESFRFKDALALSGNGWRVPSVRELASLIDCGPQKTQNRFNPGDGAGSIGYGCYGDHRRPTLLTTVFPHSHSDIFEGNYYWTSSPHANDKHSAWAVNFGDGGIYGTGRSVNLRVQMVRDRS